jgi:hypothetical protein
MYYHKEQKEIYGLGKVKLKIKWPGRLEKTQI